MVNIWKKLQAIFKYAQKQEWDLTAYSYLKGLNPILDIGCGEGRFISRNPETIIGIDWNPQSMKICKEKDYNVIQANSLPFEDGSISGIHCSHVIEHFLPSDVHKILSECDRVLIPEGILVIRSPLLWWGFYSDLTHIRPYNPEVIIRYFTPWQQHTLQQISRNYSVICLKWRYASFGTKIKLCICVPPLLKRWGFPWLKKTGYMLVLKKGR